MDCPICYQTYEELLNTDCNHSFCVNCISRIKYCAFCRVELTRAILCKEIRNAVQKNNYNEELTYDISFNEITYNPRERLNFNHPLREIMFTQDDINYLVSNSRIY